MTDDLETLRPEVAEAVAAIDGGNGVFVNSDDGIGSAKWQIVRAELLRLADENAIAKAEIRTLRNAACDFAERAEQAEAELASIKARIKPCARVVGGEVRVLMDSADEGKYVAVLVVEE